MEFHQVRSLPQGKSIPGLHMMQRPIMQWRLLVSILEGFRRAEAALTVYGTLATAPGAMACDPGRRPARPRTQDLRRRPSSRACRSWCRSGDWPLPPSPAPSRASGRACRAARRRCRARGPRKGMPAPYLSRSPAARPGVPGRPGRLRGGRSRRARESWNGDVIRGRCPLGVRLRRRHGGGRGERSWRGPCWTTCRYRSARPVSPATGGPFPATLRPAVRPAAAGWARHYEGEWRDDTYFTRSPLSRVAIASNGASVTFCRTEIPRSARNKTHMSIDGRVVRRQGQPEPSAFPLRAGCLRV